MERLSSALAVFATIAMSAFASAQEAVPRTNAPPPRVGFQMGLRTGYAVPLGKATGIAGDDMSESFGGQVPLFIEIGGKPHPNFFVGGYLGLGFGPAAGQVKNFCNDNAITCTGIGVRIGAEFQYHILPEATANPWIGYGIGYESTGIAMSAGGQTGSLTATGVEFAHFMAGVDFRLNRALGIGPVVDFSLGQYSKVRTEFPGDPVRDQEISNKAMHEWLALGVRVVFFP
jgi:hypothetical protein